MGGGGGGGGSTKYEWNDDMAPYWRNLLSESEGESNNPYQSYGGDRIAGINDDQLDAMGLIRHFVNSSGSPATIAANGELTRTLEGEWLDGNPYASGQENPWMNTQLNTDRNAYGGFSPEFQAQIDAGMGDITKAYKDATAPQADAAAVLNGTFGGGDHQRLIDQNEENLAKQLSRYSSDMRSSQWERSAGLEDNYLNRDLQAATTDKTLGGQWYNNTIDRGANAWENERNRMQGAVGGGQAEQNLALQRYNALMGVGDITRGVDQQHLDLGYQNWTDAQNWNRNQLGWLGGMLGAAQGGLPPNAQQSSGAYGASPFSNILGSALGAYGMFRA